jgi:hypothetical protein
VSTPSRWIEDESWDGGVEMCLAGSHVMGLLGWT